MRMRLNIRDKLWNLETADVISRKNCSSLATFKATSIVGGIRFSYAHEVVSRRRRRRQHVINFADFLLSSISMLLHVAAAAADVINTNAFDLNLKIH